MNEQRRLSGALYNPGIGGGLGRLRAAAAGAVPPPPPAIDPDPQPSRAPAAKLANPGAGWVLVGSHPLIERVRALVDKVAAVDSTTLIMGESGTGKELVARAIHCGSRRSARPFVPVNCAAVPAELLESEMFGHERGAFTGALAARPGLFQVANGGTIFLDEIGEMPLGLQAKLLRVLEDHEVRPLGASRSLKLDVRVVAATNQDLSLGVKAGRFREDLFYRLRVLPVILPPLRERRSDIPILVAHFLERHRARFCRPPCTVTEEAMMHLWSYDWPGNVRELENLMEQLTILCEVGRITPDELPPYILREPVKARGVVPTLGKEGINLKRLITDIEEQLIEQALRLSGGRKRGAARLLGLKRTTLLAKLRRQRPSDQSQSGHVPVFAGAPEDDEAEEADDSGDME